MNKKSKSLTDSPQTEGNWKKRLVGYFSLLVTGTGIGWLVGLSVSPVISIVITSIVGSAAAIIAAVSGLDIRDKGSDEADKRLPLNSRSLDPVPIATLVIGLVIGSYFGIQARTYDWLEPDKSLVAERWISLGLSEKDVHEAMFRSAFPNTTGVSDATESAQTKSQDGVFYGVGIQECKDLLVLTGEELKQELVIATENPHFRVLPEIIEDAELLEELLERVLCPDL